MSPVEQSYSSDLLCSGEDAAAVEFRDFGGGAVCIIETRTACNDDGGGGEKERTPRCAADVD